MAAGGRMEGMGAGLDSARHTPATATLEIAGANIFNACRPADIALAKLSKVPWQRYHFFFFSS